MRKTVKSALVAVAAVAAPLIAADPVAVRVEVTPLGAGAEGTRVAVTVQVSPEDRGRIGRNAMVRIELDGEAPPGQSPLWAVRMESDGSGRVETVWPPGEHQLRVVISDPSGRNSGLWVGTVRIPGPGAAAVETPQAQPVPTPVSRARAGTGIGVAGAAATASAAASEPPGEPATPRVPAPEPAAAAAEAPAETAASVPAAAEGASQVAAAPPPAAASEAEPETVEPERSEIGPTAAGPGPETADAAVAAAAVAAAGAAAPAVRSAPEAGPDEQPRAVDESPPARDEGVGEEPPVGGSEQADRVTTPAVEEPETRVEPKVEPEAVAVEAPPIEPALPPAVVEPLRGEPVPPAGSAETAAAAAPEPEAGPPPAAVAAAYAAWADADPAATELTAVVLRRREPVNDLAAANLRLQVGRAEVAIDAVGGADRAPLLLGIAVDAAPESGIGWPGAGGRLAALAARAADDRGRLFYAAPGSAVGEWNGGPVETVAAPEGGGVASLIVASLQRFDGERGRRFLLVVTDGRSEPDKEAWQQAVAAAGEAGAPVLVVALWDERFSQRTRKNLREIAEVSGGSLFLVQGSAQLDRAAERFGPLLDAGVAVRFRLPEGVALPAPIALDSPDRELEISAPRAIR